jgi:helix-turn-helix protein
MSQTQPEWMTRSETAEMLRKPVTTLAAWAYRGVGPGYVRVGRSVLYSRIEVERWLERHRIAPEAKR